MIRCVRLVPMTAVTTQRADYIFLDSPPEVLVSFPTDDIQDKSFKVKFETKNINSKQLSHFYLEVYRDVVEYGQVRYKIADFDTLSKNLDEMTVWREVEPLTRYEVWVTAKGYNNKQLADPTIKKITTKMSRFDYDETQVCSVDWPQTFKDEMVTSCDHMDVVPAGHRCYTYCKDDWRKMRGTEYMTCMNIWMPSTESTNALSSIASAHHTAVLALSRGSVTFVYFLI